MIAYAFPVAAFTVTATSPALMAFGVAALCVAVKSTLRAPVGITIVPVEVPPAAAVGLLFKDTLAPLQATFAAFALLAPMLTVRATLVSVVVRVNLKTNTHPAGVPAVQPVAAAVPVPTTWSPTRIWAQLPGDPGEGA